MRIVVVDGQGGKLGKMLIEAVKKEVPGAHITAIGTNSIATAAMLKGGATEGATGENPLVIAARKADVIVGPIGIVIADSLLGEVTEKMATAVSRSEAIRVLIPMNKCDNLVAGVKEQPMTALIEDAIQKIKQSTETTC